MAEYITKDDATILIALLDEKKYTLEEAKDLIQLKKRLKAYFDDPDAKRIDPKK